MKKLMLFVMASVCSLGMFAQTPEAKEELKGEVSPAVSALRLASDLVKYGYAQQSALPLVDALQIIAENPTQPMNAERQGTEVAENGEGKNGKVTLDFATIAASAKEFADGDETILKLIAQVEADSQSNHRGAVNGPREACYAVAANGVDTYELSFVKGYLAEIGVAGDGDTDLDLYVYDSNGNPIAADTSYSGDCYVNWVPAWTGRYIIKVVNRGPIYNRYVIVTN